MQQDADITDVALASFRPERIDPRAVDLDWPLLWAEDGGLLHPAPMNPVSGGVGVPERPSPFDCLIDLFWLDSGSSVDESIRSHNGPVVSKVGVVFFGAVDVDHAKNGLNPIDAVAAFGVTVSYWTEGQALIRTDELLNPIIHLKSVAVLNHVGAGREFAFPRLIGPQDDLARLRALELETNALQLFNQQIVDEQFAAGSDLDRRGDLLRRRQTARCDVCANDCREDKASRQQYSVTDRSWFKIHR